MTDRVAARRRGRLWRGAVMCLLLVVAVGFILFGRALAADLARGGRTFAMTKRRLEALRSFALFRSRGDKAVLRWGEPPAKTRSKKSHAN
jgi:hypothetical protein